MSAPFDLAAIMRDAWKRFRDGKRLGLGWTFGRCLSTARAAAKIRRANRTAGPHGSTAQGAALLAFP
jgi:hypothetical protein